MRHLIFFLLAGCIFSINANAQDSRYDAAQLKDKRLFVQYHNKILSYDCEQEVTVGSSTEWKEPVAITVKHASKEVNVMMEFLNPLHATVSMTTENSPDPNAVSLSLFFDAFGQLMTAVIPGTTAGAISGSQDSQPSDIALIAAIKNDALRHMLLHLYTTSCCCDTTQCNIHKRLHKIIEMLAACENKQEDFMTSAKDLFVRYNAVNSIASYRNDTINFTAAEKDLGKQIDDIAKKLEAIRTIQEWLEEDENSNCPICKLNAMYATSTLELYYAECSVLQEKRKTLLSELKKIRQPFDYILLHSQGEYWIVKTVPVPDGEQVELTITVKTRETKIDQYSITASEKETSTYKFIIRQYSWVVIEFSPGFVWSPLATPKYSVSTVNGQQVVTEAGKDKVNAAAVSFLNLVIPLRSYNAHPLFQVGLSIGKNQPLFLMGGGFRLSNGLNHVVFSTGVAFGFYHALQHLEEHDVVAGEADLEKDLKYELYNKPAIYFGIQYSIPLKK